NAHAFVTESHAVSSDCARLLQRVAYTAAGTSDSTGGSGGCTARRGRSALFAARGTVVDHIEDMTRKASWLIPFSVLLVTCITAADAGECLTMKVSPRQALAPVNLRVSVRIEPSADNRALTIVAETSDFYRSSQIQLEGDRAPRVVSVEYPNVPGGEYN